MTLNYKKLLIFDTRLYNINILVNSLQSDVVYILLDYAFDTIDILKKKINTLNKSLILSIGLVRDEYFGEYYKLVDNQSPCILQNIELLDKNLNTWSHIIDFLIYLKTTFNIINFDFISCNLKKYNAYNYIFNKLELLTKTEISASYTIIGNTQYISNWSFENNNRNIKDIYFTDNIKYYPNLLGLPIDLYGIPKYYDKTREVYLSLSGILNEDINNIYLISYDASFNDPDIGLNKTIIYSNLTLSGTVLNNYTLPPLFGETIGNIIPKSINLILNQSTKIYDGTVNLNNLYLDLSGVIYDDYITISSYISNYRFANVGEQIIDISNIILFGNKSFNYIINNTSYLGYIFKKILTFSYISSKITYTGLQYTDYNITTTDFVNNDSITSLSGMLSYIIISNVYTLNPSEVNYIIGGYGSKTIMWSYNGINWSNALNNPFTNYCMNVATNNIKWVAVGSGIHSIAWSDNGKTWYGLGTDIFTIYGLGIVYNKNKWYAVGQGTNTIAWSNDGIIWNGLGSDVFSTFCRNIAGNNTLLVAVGQGINTIAYSYNGTNWVGLGDTLFDDFGIAVVNNNYIWIAFGKGSLNTIAYSYNGIDWIGLGKNIFENYGSFADWDGYKWVAVGSGSNTIAYSYNGIDWIGLGNTIFSTIGRSISWNGSIWLAVGNDNIYVANSIDGINWTSVTTPGNLSIGYDIETKKTYKYLELNEVKNVGSYIITANGLFSKNYNIYWKPGILEILKAPLYLKINDYHKIYNGIEISDFGLSFSGFQNIDNSSNLTGTLKYYYNNGIPLNVGQYYITTSGLVGLNYNIKYLQGIINITKAPLLVRTNNITKLYDKLFITPTVQLYGFQNNDTSSDLSGTLYFIGNYINQINVGEYNMIPNGLTSINYNIKYVSEKLNIIKSPLLIIANDDSRIYANDISNLTIIYNSNYFTLF